ncbi:MAG: hypothetical protein HYX78_07465, partial [Armatimonadetes bacterium]|nr:hypothetical protein [Armatimonadota bacterium]
TICLGIGYQMKPDAPCDATYTFDVVDAQVMGVDGTVGCWNGLPVSAATKTIYCPPTECCLQLSYAYNVADHVWVSDITNPDRLNLMANLRICNPDNCPPAVFQGLKLKAWGSGNDQTDIVSVKLFLDQDCDGRPDSTTEYASGVYNADDGTVTLCSTSAIGPITLDSGQCICVLIYYDMVDDLCPPVGSTYFFEVEAALGLNCKDICIEPKLKSAVKTIGECCLRIEKHPNSPPDHTWPPPVIDKEFNEMLLLNLVNPCCEQGYNAFYLNCLTLQASGTGNDLNDILNIVIWEDADCDGVLDGGETTWILPNSYTGDDGTAVICIPGGYMMPPLGPAKCLGIAYVMDPSAPCNATYSFQVINAQITRLDGTDGCWTGLPVGSATKTIKCAPCCVEVYKGPNSPPSHWWVPGKKKLNNMLQLEVKNPCNAPATIKCVTLQPSGTGNDATNINQVRVYVDLNCNGQVDLGEPLFGAGTYPADDTATTICGSYTLPAGGSVCLLMSYVMNNSTLPGRTFKVCLTDITAADSAGNEICVNLNPPAGQNLICSGVKKRCWKLIEIKLWPIPIKICLHAIVIATFPDRFYVMDPEREAGIAVIATPGLALPPVGSEVEIEGDSDVVDSEVIVIPDSITVVGQSSIEPVGMNNRAVGGGPAGSQPGVALDCCLQPPTMAVGSNNVGMLVTTWGRVTHVSAPHFWVDDGANRKDGARDLLTGECILGVRVNATHAYLPRVGQYVAVTGISRVLPPNPCNVSTIWPRSDADIRVIR